MTNHQSPITVPLALLVAGESPSRREANQPATKRVKRNVRTETHGDWPQGRGEGCEPPPASCRPGPGRRLRWRQRSAERAARAGEDLGRQPEGMVLFLDHRPGGRRQGAEGAAA